MGVAIIVNGDAIQDISEYCKGRDYKCRACRFSIHKYTDATGKCGKATCIFGDCPCDWEVKRK